MVLDDNVERHNAFDNCFNKDQVEHAWTYWDAVALLDSELFDLVYLDHDLNDFEHTSIAQCSWGDRELTGVDIARFIALELDVSKRPKRVIVHSWNPDGARLMVNILRDVGILSTYEPFSSS